ncbi:hypothetical protein EJP82_11965 [Paenibacillus anaericanus]|uniref:DUF1795 domain-containing protein n=1 Tax=Paenibacillus anaericanus TaxID=170367 RepID=A0A3S1DSV9_9BACL|nr:hypothetical protein [Paenibacillus anaericanus]RUT46557.1 hypothetical protein EJP82_11965 [Paenibacillus anaericanus]
MKHILALSVICLILITTCSKPDITASSEIPKGKFELQQVELFPNEMKINIPRDFEIMTDEMAELKYPNGNRPSPIYTNNEGSVNVAFNYTSTELTDKELKDYLKNMKSMFENLYPSATWYESKMVEINNKKVGYLELLTPAIDTQVYNLIFLAEMNNRLLLVNFNCTESEMTEWIPTAKEIMYSLIID